MLKYAPTNYRQPSLFNILDKRTGIEYFLTNNEQYTVLKQLTFLLSYTDENHSYKKRCTSI